MEQEMETKVEIENADQDIDKSNEGTESHAEVSGDVQEEKSQEDEKVEEVQDDKTENCGTCGLCWESQERQIIFKTH